MIIVRPIRPDEAARLKSVRLRALRDAPEAFLTTAAQAEARPDEVWEMQAARGSRGEDWRIFFAESDSTETVGMVAAAIDPARPRVVELFQMWVDPSWRGRSVGLQLLEAVLAWGRTRADRIRLGVASDHTSPIRLYEGAGFAHTGEESPFEGRPGVSVRYFERAIDE